MKALNGRKLLMAFWIVVGVSVAVNYTFGTGSFLGKVVSSLPGLIWFLYPAIAVAAFSSRLDRPRMAVAVLLLGSTIGGFFLLHMMQRVDALSSGQKITAACGLVLVLLPFVVAGLKLNPRNGGPRSVNMNRLLFILAMFLFPFLGAYVHNKLRAAGSIALSDAR